MSTNNPAYTLAAYTTGMNPKLLTKMVRWKEWLEFQVPLRIRQEEELWGIPVTMYYRTEGDGAVNKVAQQILMLQSQTGDLVFPKGTVVFVPKDPNQSIESLLPRLEQWLRD